MSEGQDYRPIALRALPSNLPQLPMGMIPEPMTEAPIHDYFKVVLKYLWLIGAITGSFVLLSLIYAFTATPRYKAEAKLRISTYEPVLSATKIEDMLQEQSKEVNYFETKIQEIKSYTLADQVLQNEVIHEAIKSKGKTGFLARFESLLGIGAAEDAPIVDVGGGYQHPVQLIRRYLALISAEPVRRTSLVVLSALTTNPNLSALVVNKHAEAYIDWIRKNRIEQQSRGLQFLQGQAEELREKVADLERESADYAEANSIVAVNKDENITAQKMSQLSKMYTDVTAKKIEAENLYREAEKSLKNPSAGYDDQSTQTMRAELAKLEGEFGEMSAKFTLSYPKMRELKAQIEVLKDSIQKQRSQIVLGLKSKAQAAAEEEAHLKEELDQQTTQTFELSKRQVQYNVLQRELTSSRELLQNVLKQIKETSLAVESNASNISVIDYAVPPDHAAYPRKNLIALMGLVAGLSVGLGVAFLLSLIDNSVRTPEDLTTLLALPNLGVVPSFESEPESRSMPRLVGPELEGDDGASPPTVADEHQFLEERGVVFMTDPKSLAAEAYRTVRTAILLSQAGEPPKTILISSAQSSEGKTTSAINLAASLAGAGGRVVLIDADLRRPSVNRHFKLESGLPGLVDVLTGQAVLDSVMIPDLIPNVTVMPSGIIPPNPAELLGSVQMAQLLDELAKLYDYVLIDSPPVLPVTDSVVLSRYVDGVVLVVKGAHTSRKIALDAKRRLEAVGARILGTILNDVNLNSGEYYYYRRYYRAYYRPDGTKSSRRSAA